MDRKGERDEASIRLGAVEVDTRRRLLLRGTQEIPIGRPAMDLLLAFLRQPGVLLSPQSLVASAWPDAVVGDSNLRVQIGHLRRAIGDGEAGRRYIQNVPGRGYRFIFPADPEQPAAAHSGIAGSGGNRPVPLQRIVGRDELITTIVARLQHRRLLTIVGPGGIGKTSVATLVANAFAPQCPDGVHWIDIGALAPDDSIAGAIALSAGLATFTHDPLPGVLAWLKDKRLLLVLDCCERAVAAVAPLAEQILRAAQGVQILATSREVLRAAGEHVVRLPSLPVPPETAGLTPEQALAYPAIQLFAERAASVLGGFTLRDSDVPHVVRICTRLDGIALAIELAVGHLIAIELKSLSALLDDRFRLLAVGRRTAVARHRTMHAVLEWSHETLSENERRVLHRISIFEGEIGLTAVRAVIADDLSVADTVEALARLVDKSLVTTRVGAAGLSYSLLDTTRVFALERLSGSAVFPEICRRHARYLLLSLGELEADEKDVPVADWLAKRRHLLGNARAALKWAYSCDIGQPLKFALSFSVSRILMDLSLVDECRQRTAQALDAMAREDIDDIRLEMRLRALMAVASFYTPGPLPQTVATLERVVAIATDVNDEEYRAIALWGLWSVCIFRGEPDKSVAYAEQFRRTHGALSSSARDLLGDRMTGTALHLLGDQQGAYQSLERVSARFSPALHAWDNLGLHVNHGLMARIYLARVLWLQGEPDRALRLCAESIGELQAQGHAIALCHALFEVSLPLNYLAGNLVAVQSGLRLLQDLAGRHGLAIFQAGAAWAELAFAAQEHDGDLFACRAAAEALHACRYEAQSVWLAGLMAEAAARRGDIAAAIAWVEPYLKSGLATGKGWWTAELLRIRAELAARDAQTTASVPAQWYFQHALDIARRQGAVSLELRVLIGFMRYRRAHHAPEDMSRDLSEILGRFSDGSETTDMIAARGLLADFTGS